MPQKPGLMSVSESNAAADAKYGAIAKEYDSRYVGRRWDLYDRVTLETAQEFLPQTGRVLDAGAGTGKFSLHFLKRGYHVTLLDPSAEMLEVARYKVGQAVPGASAQYAVGTIERMDFPDNHFDFVFCEGDPLSYCITSHREAAKELLRVLKPGGGFYVSCDNRAFAALIMLGSGHVGSALAAVERGESVDPYEVAVHAFDPAELNDLFAAAGAWDVRVTGKMGLLHLLADPFVETLLANDDLRRRFHELEITWAKDPARAGMAGHLHVVGRKG